MQNALIIRKEGKKYAYDYSVIRSEYPNRVPQFYSITLCCLQMENPVNQEEYEM